jgi:6-phospho-beta-glucosidase
MTNALRTIPVLLDIARDVREYAAPNALMANFTNPAGLVTQALSKYAPDVQAVGVCNVPITAKMMILEILEKELKTPLDPSHAELKTLGLNHLSWHCGFTLDGEDVWPQVINATVNQLRSEEDPEWEPELIESLQMIPNYYLHYYYHTEHKISEQQKWPPSRAEEVMEVEKDLLREYADPEMIEPPADLMKRGGAYYSTVATQLLNAHYNNLDENHIVNFRQGGAVEGWPADWVLEMPCKINRAGIHPNPASPLPSACYNLLAQVKEYELLTVEAAVKGDRKILCEALAAHPLGPKTDRIQAVAEDILETNREYLAYFWK